MTVPNLSNKNGPYQGNGVTVLWPFDFPVIDKSHIQVVLTDPNGAETILTKDYWIDLQNKRVKYPGYEVGTEPPVDQQPPILPSGWWLTLVRKVPRTQELDLVTQGAYYAEDVEAALDKITMIAQDIGEVNDRTLRLPVSASADISVQLPQPQALKSFRWDVTGKKLEVTDDPKVSADAAAASAGQAQGHANAAAGSAAAAAGSATAAQNHANTAQGHANAAAGFADQAEEKVQEVQTYINHVSNTDNPHATTAEQVGAIHVPAGSAQGDLIYRNGANWDRLPAGTPGQFLKTLGAEQNPVWDDITIPSHGMQFFTANGTFTVPENVYQVFVTLCGGSGGGGSLSGMEGSNTYKPGGNGGTTSFGAYISKAGGLGGYNGNANHYRSIQPSVFGGEYGSSVKQASFYYTYSAGTTYSGGAEAGEAGAGVIKQAVAVTPGQQINVTIGVAGTAGAAAICVAGQPGACLVEW